ncbi:MAG: LD-carboxypeptidase [Chitinophagaceae bacterium]|nr:MAG: LD-carboxypeptidase [Chitinophagaceae bacterium]
MTIPPYLKKADLIGITCPAGFMPLEKAQTCINTLQEWGYNVLAGKTLGSQSGNYFSGTDEERAAELQSMLDDPSIKAILFGRGGYGTSRILDKLSFKKFKKNPKWLIGFSDITILHTHLYNQFKIASLHAPMAAAFNDGEAGNEYILSLKAALEGTRAEYTCAPHPLNKPGSATGKLIGGNLALLIHGIGTESEANTKNCILFLEDIGEYLYSIDRMLLHLKRAGKLDKLAGLIFGGFTDMKDTDRPFGKTIDEILEDITRKLDIPVCFNFPVSHSKENYALKVGVEYNLIVGTSGVILKEK